MVVLRTDTTLLSTIGDCLVGVLESSATNFCARNLPLSGCVLGHGVPTLRFSSSTKLVVVLHISALEIDLCRDVSLGMAFLLLVLVVVLLHGENLCDIK